MDTPKIIRIVPAHYNPDMFVQPEEIKGSVEFVKSTNVDRLNKLFHQSLVSIGETYIRSPYDSDMFFKIENYEMEAWKAKIGHIANIARILGATGASFNMQIGDKKSRKINYNIKGGSNSGASGSVNFSKNEELQLQAIIQSNLHFNPNASLPSQQAYNNAIALAKAHNLYYSTDGTEIRNLLNYRNPQDSNPLKQWDFHTNLCSETNSDLKLAATLMAPSLMLNVDSDFIDVVKYIKTIQVDVSFSF